MDRQTTVLRIVIEHDRFQSVNETVAVSEVFRRINDGESCGQGEEHGDEFTFETMKG